MYDFNNNYPGYPSYGTDMPGMDSMQGKWTNKRTGEVVMVRDTILMDNSITIMLADGRVLDMNDFSRDYIQISDEEYGDDGSMINGAVSGKYKGEHSHAPVMDTPDPDFREDFIDLEDLRRKDFGHHEHNHHHGHHHFPEPPHHKPPMFEPPMCDCDETTRLIEKVFDKIKPTVGIDVKIISHDFPIDELNMLINVFGITRKDIGKYLYQNYIGQDSIIAAIDDFLKESLSNKDEEKPETPETPDTPELPDDTDVKFEDDLDPGFTVTPEEEHRPKPPKKNKCCKHHHHKRGDNPSSGPYPWEDKEDECEDRKNRTDLLGDTYPGIYLESGAFQYYNKEGHLCLIYKEDDGHYVYFENIDHDWYQVTLNDEGELEYEKLPVAPSVKDEEPEEPEITETEDDTHAFGPDNKLHEGEWTVRENGDKVFSYQEGDIEWLIVEDQTGNRDYLYRKENKWYIRNINPDGSFTDTEI